MTTVEVLRAARALIERPECWTQGQFARCRLGRHIGPTDPDAVCWCPLGAIYKITEHYPAEPGAIGALRIAAGASIRIWNDSHTHAEVLAGFDRAIEIAERAL